MKLIVGLGNPGDKYENSRHNLGFMILMRFLEDIEPDDKAEWNEERRFQSILTTCTWIRKDGTNEKIFLALPTTFMNDSGAAVKAIADFYKISPEDVWIVYDELDLPLGSMKVRFGGATAGHKGVTDIMAKLGTDKFWRFRMGIGDTKQHIPRSTDESDGQGRTIARTKIRDAADYVLGVFDKSQQTELKHLLKEGSKALQVALESGVEVARIRFNTK